MPRIPHTYAITFSLIILCAILTWIIPAGEFTREVINIDGVSRTVIVENSFHSVESSPQSWQVFAVLLQGFEKQAGIIAFLLIIGGAFQILGATRAVESGIKSFLKQCRSYESNAILKRIGTDNLIIASVVTLFSLFGAIFGMSEETLAFIAIIIPLAISMGYDSLTGICMVYVAAHVGFSGAILNPFTIGLAQGLSEIPIFSGYLYRSFCWAILTAALIVVILLYARYIKKHPERSPMYELDAHWHNIVAEQQETMPQKASKNSWFVFIPSAIVLSVFAYKYSESTFSIGSASCTVHALPVIAVSYIILSLWALCRRREVAASQMYILNLLLFTIILLVVGVMAYGWYLSEISGIFLAMGIMSGYASGMNTNDIIAQFITGTKDILTAAIVVGLASGIIIILENGHIIDAILFNLSSLLGSSGKLVSVEAMYIIQTVINIIIPSGSAKAALTMPIMAPFSDVIGLSRQATVMAYQFGDGLTNMITPTSGVLMGALALARIPYAIWFKWFGRILIGFILLAMLLLIPTVTMNLQGF